MSNKLTNIVLILKKGGDFSFKDANLLVAHINKYWAASKPRPKVYCYTDLIVKETELVGMTLRPLPNAWRGWWSKMNLFHADLKALRPFLYLDLDTAIVGDISCMVPDGSEGTPLKEEHFITLQDFYRPSRLASGVMWVPDTIQMDAVYSEWIKNPAMNMKKFRGDQNFVESVTKANMYWQIAFQENVVTTFKPNNKWRTVLPHNSRVICFHGKPRIGEAANTVQWVKDYTSYAI